MRIAVLNNSGNVGKTTIARHLLSPRMGNCPILFVESINEGGDETNFKGRDFKDVLSEMTLHPKAVVDIGSSNIEAVYTQLRKLREAHEEFDYYVVPAVPAVKQQRDTAKTIESLLEIGVPSQKLRVVFNMVEPDDSIEKIFPELVRSARENGIPTDAVIYQNELFQIIGSDDTVENSIVDIPALKEQLAETPDIDEKRKLATAIGVSRLAKGVQEDLDGVFAALFGK